MCGRYATARSADQLALEFGAVDASGGRLAPTYNVAPTDQVPIVRRTRPPAPGGESSGGAGEAGKGVDSGAGRGAGQPTRKVTVAKWGLVPSWAKDTKGGARMINARAESITDKPAFRVAFERRRALIPADGWYEWTPRPHRPGKQPYYLTQSDGSVLAMAGLWEVWGHGEELVYTCSVVTTEAVGPLADVHDRMPLLLPPDRWEEWLGPVRTTAAGAGPTAGADGERTAANSAEPEIVFDPARLLAPPPMEFLAGLEIRPVGTEIGNVRNNYPRLTERQPEQPEQGTLL